MVNQSSLLDLLRASPWPLSVEDVARVLQVDENTAQQALDLLVESGRAKKDVTRWIVR